LGQREGESPISCGEREAALAAAAALPPHLRVASIPTRHGMGRSGEIKLVPKLEEMGRDTELNPRENSGRERPPSDRGRDRGSPRVTGFSPNPLGRSGGAADNVELEVVRM